MPRLEPTIEQVIELIRQLPPEDKRIVLATLNAELAAAPELDDEDRDWLEADLEIELLPYDWGKAEIPQGQSVRYIPDRGWVIEGERKVVQ